MTKDGMIDYLRQFYDTVYFDEIADSHFNKTEAAESLLKLIKEEAIGFLKWYGVKVAGLVEYIKDIRPSVTSGEIEEKIKEFEGKTIDELYSLYQQSKSKQP